MEDIQERLIRYLQDAHASETGIVTVLNGFIEETNNSQARAVFEEHRAVTQRQAERLEQRLTALGSGSSTAKGIFNKLMGSAADLMNAGHDAFDKTTQDLIKAYATEYLEIGMYTALQAYAQAIGDTETASLAQQILREEQDAADKIYPLIALTAPEAVQAVQANRTEAIPAAAL